MYPSNVSFFIFQTYSKKKNVSLPWNQNSTLGYFGEITFTFFSGMAFIGAFGSMFLLFVGVALHYQALAKIYERSISKLDSCEGLNKRVHLCQLVEFNISTKRCVIYGKIEIVV